MALVSPAPRPGDDAHLRARASLHALLVQAAVEERTTLARDLHDTVGQRLWTIGLAVDRLVGEAPDELQRELADLREQVQELRDDLRGSLHRLRRSELGERTLGVALCALAAELAARRSATLLLRVPPVWRHAEPQVEDQLWCVALEAITNAQCHGSGTPITVTWELDESDTARLAVRNRPAARRADPDGMGVAGMRSRLRGLGGTLTVGVEHDGQWAVRATVPAGSRSLTGPGHSRRTG
jgi:signal transduction histidine kinase